MTRPATSTPLSTALGSAALRALTWVLICTLGMGQVEEPPTPQDSAKASPRLGTDLAARSDDTSLSFEELDELLLWRYGRSPDGQAALKQLIELHVLEALATDAKIEISSSDLSRRWSELEADIKASGVAEDLPAYLAQSGITRETFLEYLRLALVHEALTRAALGLQPGEPITGDQQSTWLESVLAARGVEHQVHPWPDGIVVRSAEVEITRGVFAEHLRKMLPPDDLTAACHQLILQRRLLARMPDLSAEAMGRLVEEGIERRRASTEDDPRYQGVSYERLLEAQGLSIEAVRRDPALAIAVLSRFWIDRAHDDASLREIYAAERALFDGAYGEGVESLALVLKAAKLPNDLVPRSFEDAEVELVELRSKIGSIADFKRLTAEHSEDPVSRERGGSLGIVTRDTKGVPESVRKSIFAALDAARSAGVDDVSGTILGPLRFGGGTLLLALGQRRPAPTWEEMATKVQGELRRRFLVELLPPDSVVTWLNQ
ncbi:MAG TPA: hypothetical protein EYQ74_04490 [Planctomycetes bacterium]|nr:hypothetical protein [Planctomycetota bacterium]HIK61255.1 hypothetical protein [Planctomycetota bacterium]